MGMYTGPDYVRGGEGAAEDQSEQAAPSQYVMLSTEDLEAALEGIEQMPHPVSVRLQCLEMAVQHMELSGDPEAVIEYAKVFLKFVEDF